MKIKKKKNSEVVETVMANQHYLASFLFGGMNEECGWILAFYPKALFEHRLAGLLTFSHHRRLPVFTVAEIA
jgi:hypothetical protein